MLNNSQKIVKRSFDILVSIFILLLIWWLILLLLIISTIDTRATGIIVQKRVGYKGELFKIYKIRTMKRIPGNTSSVTVKNDPRVTKVGRYIRRLKLDELPQFINVLIGNMSIVGPRPDMQGFADKLVGSDRILLTVKPGITGPATIYFRKEEALLAKQESPEVYNKEVIWPKKVEINKEYINNYHIISDIKYIIKTIFN